MKRKRWNRKLPAWKKKPITAKEKAEKKEIRLTLQALTKRRKSVEEKLQRFPMIKISHR